YLLRDTNIAVYIGEGTSGGALWHIEPPERVHFDVDILRTEDIRAGDFADNNVVSFPSGGFYAQYIGDVGNEHVRRFVARGNGFLGTCGGNVYGVKLGL